MKIVLASCQNLPDWEIDDHPFHLELTRQGITFECHPWDSDIDWGCFELCILRTTWDYVDRIQDFKSWLERVSLHTKLLNPLKLVSWNLNKGYLLDLAERGVPIAPTEWISRSVSVRELMERNGWEKGFLKPVVGASASDTLRFTLKECTEAQAFLDNLISEKEMMLQPYLKRVETEGEFSAIYFGGQLSHCVQKIPVKGDYRVQDDYGASDYAIEPIIGLTRLAEQTLENIGEGWLYARVDALRLEDGTWVLNELEMVEPSLFFRHSAAAAEKFVTTIKYILQSMSL